MRRLISVILAVGAVGLLFGLLHREVASWLSPSLDPLREREARSRAQVVLLELEAEISRQVREIVDVGAWTVRALENPAEADLAEIAEQGSRLVVPAAGVTVVDEDGKVVASRGSGPEMGPEARASLAQGQQYLRAVTKGERRQLELWIPHGGGAVGILAEIAPDTLPPPMSGARAEWRRDATVLVDRGAPVGTEGIVVEVTRPGPVQGTVLVARAAATPVELIDSLQRAVLWLGVAVAGMMFFATLLVPGAKAAPPRAPAQPSPAPPMPPAPSPPATVPAVLPGARTSPIGRDAQPGPPATDLPAADEPAADEPAAARSTQTEAPAASHDEPPPSPPGLVDGPSLSGDLSPTFAAADVGPSLSGDLQSADETLVPPPAGLVSGPDEPLDGAPEFSAAEASEMPTPDPASPAASPSEIDEGWEPVSMGQGAAAPAAQTSMRQLDPEMSSGDGASADSPPDEFARSAPRPWAEAVPSQPDAPAMQPFPNFDDPPAEPMSSAAPRIPPPGEAQTEVGPRPTEPAPRVGFRSESALTDAVREAGRVAQETGEIAHEAPEPTPRSETRSEDLPEVSMPRDSYDEAHYRSVYEVFRHARAEIGDPVQSLTFEGFRRRLETSERSLRAKHACRLVRFQVLIREQKVTLRPQLIR